MVVSVPKPVEAEARINLNPCVIEDAEAAECGTYEVFEDRRAKSGRRIPLKIVVLRAVETNRNSDPLFILAGGPGQAASENAKFFNRVFAQVRRQRDIVMVDQRGTGGSNGLDCDIFGATVQGHLGDLFPIRELRRCAGEWKKRADLRLYTTDIAMQDLDEVREAMGYQRINLFGTSYGTRAAQVYMRQFPDRVRSVIMKGVTPITTALTVPMARDAQRALDLTFEDCRADKACGEIFPGLVEKWRAVLARLDRGEVQVEITDPETRKAVRVAISRATVTPTIRSLLQGVEGAAQVPLMIDRASKDDFAPLATAALEVRRGFRKVVSAGMFLAITTAEDMPVSPPDEVAHASRDTFLQDYYFQQLQRAAEIMPRGEVPAGYREPVKSDVPTLLISGFVDPATPPSGAEEVARHLTKSRHVVVRYGSHSYGGLSPCMDDIMAEFIERGSAEGIDPSCVEQVRRPAFVAARDSSAAEGVTKTNYLAIKNVTVIDSTGAAAQPAQTVLVKGDRVDRIAPAKDAAVPEGARVVDGIGKFLLPGLWDMHMHLSHVSDSAFPVLIANGVTGVRDMGGDLEQVDRWREQIRSGAVIGPRVFRTGAVVDGPRGEEGQFRLTVTNAAEAREAVRSLQRRGVDLVKVYHFLSRESYLAVADECKQVGIAFAGHVPNGVHPADASDAGQRSIEHLAGVIQALSSTRANPGKDSKQLTVDTVDALLGAEGQEIFGRFARNGTWHTPTLVVSRSFLLRAELAAKADPRRKYVASIAREYWEKHNPVPENVPEELMIERRQFLDKIIGIVGAMKRAGVSILAGTDPPTRDIFPGWSLHDELGLLVKAGLTPMEAIQAATKNAAEALGVPSDYGTVEKGKMADLVLLDANPLVEIGNTGKIAAVILGGRLFEKPSLDHMIEKVAAAND